MHDRTADGRALKCLTVIDEFTRETLTAYANRTISWGHVQAVLTPLFAIWGQLECIRSDNGPQLIAHQLQAWLAKRKVNTRYIDPDSPWQNPYNESFNAVLRDSCLKRWLFTQ